ncbi:MAG: outer membrane lipoprotein carrier protein LolA, partial [Rhodanobacter sp.]
MRRLIAPLFLSCLLLCVASVTAQTATTQATAPDDALLQHVLAELGQHQAVRAGFVQTRANPALTQPQVSRGQLLFVLNHGMLWQTQ